MNEIELKDLVAEITEQKCEKQYIELKEASGGTPKRLVRGVHYVPLTLHGFRFCHIG